MCDRCKKEIGDDPGEVFEININEGLEQEEALQEIDTEAQVCSDCAAKAEQLITDWVKAGV